MKKLTVQFRRSPRETIIVGHLAETDRRIFFEYDAQFLKRGLQLSPFKMPLRAGLIEHTDHGFGPLPGLFDDSLPDGWGLLLMDRMFRRRGLTLDSVSPIDRLAYLGTRTMGALTYHPPENVECDRRLIDLHAVGRNAAEIHRGDGVEVLPELMRAGGSPGGARPKVLIGLKKDWIISGEDDLPTGFAHWMVKFAAGSDGPDAGPIEFAYADMARAAGIDMPQTRLFHAGGKDAYFGVRRFDRGPRNRRFHVHTFGNLLHANFRAPSTDYSDLLKVVMVLTRSEVDLMRAFRRMAFNIAAHNRDDHAKNFSFIMNDEAGEWSLAPAYDLVHSKGPGGEHSMSILREGRAPTREHIMTMAGRFSISQRRARDVIDRVNAAVARWGYFADRAGCSKKTIRGIASTLQPL